MAGAARDQAGLDEVARQGRGRGANPTGIGMNDVASKKAEAPGVCALKRGEQIHHGEPMRARGSSDLSVHVSPGVMSEILEEWENDDDHRQFSRALEPVETLEGIFHVPEPTGVDVEVVKVIDRYRGATTFERTRGVKGEVEQDAALEEVQKTTGDRNAEQRAMALALKNLVCDRILRIVQDVENEHEIGIERKSLHLEEALFLKGVVAVDPEVQDLNARVLRGSSPIELPLERFRKCLARVGDPVTDGDGVAQRENTKDTGRLGTKELAVPEAVAVRSILVNADVRDKLIKKNGIGVPSMNIHGAVRVMHPSKDRLRRESAEEKADDDDREVQSGEQEASRRHGGRGY